MIVEKNAMRLLKLPLILLSAAVKTLLSLVALQVLEAMLLIDALLLPPSLLGKVLRG